PKHKTVFGKCIGNRVVNIAGRLSFAHELACCLQCLRIRIRHGLSACAKSATNQRTRKFDPIAACTSDFQRVEEKVICCNHAVAWHFERCFGLALGAGEKNVHHAWTGATGKEALHGGRHDFGFGFARLVSGDQSPEAVENDVHCIAHFGEFFLAFYCARHIKLKIERDEFKLSVAKLAIITNRHDEVHSIDTNSHPVLLVPYANECFCSDDRFQVDLAIKSSRIAKRKSCHFEERSNEKSGVVFRKIANSSLRSE